MLPRLETFQGSGIETELFIEQRIKDVLDLASITNKGLACFIEDKLAYELLKDERVVWLTGFGDADRLWLQARDKEYEELYKAKEWKQFPERLYKAIAAKYAYPKEILKSNSEESIKIRLALMGRRLRDMMSMVFDEVAYNIAFIDVGRKDWTVPEVSLGDGKRIIQVTWDSTKYSYSGIPFEKSEFVNVLGME